MSFKSAPIDLFDFLTDLGIESHQAAEITLRKENQARWSELFYKWFDDGYQMACAYERTFYAVFRELAVAAVAKHPYERVAAIAYLRKHFKEAIQNALPENDRKLGEFTGIGLHEARLIVDSIYLNEYEREKLGLGPPPLDWNSYRKDSNVVTRPGSYGVGNNQKPPITVVNDETFGDAENTVQALRAFQNTPDSLATMIALGKISAGYLSNQNLARAAVTVYPGKIDQIKALRQWTLDRVKILPSLPELGLRAAKELIEDTREEMGQARFINSGPLPNNLPAQAP